MKPILLLLACVTQISAAGPYGADNGWAIANDGSPLLTPALASAMAQAGTGWIRIEMRLIPGHSVWDDQLLGFYDAAVNNALDAGLQVVMLVDGGSWPGRQSDWEQNNLEKDGGDGCNPYNTGFVNQALDPIVMHFRGRVSFFELWNEPNAWTQSYGVGGTFMYPSNFACLLAQSWVAVHAVRGISDAVLFSGGIFGHSIGGQYSYGTAGAQYIDDTYAAGIRTGQFTDVLNRFGTYPVDGVGQHIYIDQGGATTPERVRQYLDWMRLAYAKYEGNATAKRIFITEVGWTTHSVSQAVQDQNLQTVFQVFDTTPYLAMAIWFQWKDNPAAGLYYGVVDANDNAKAALAHYRTYQTFEGAYADRSTSVPILDYFQSLGAAVLGVPFDTGATPWVHPSGSGVVQSFVGGAHGALLLMSSERGTYEVNNLHGIYSEYLARDGIRTLGYPLANEQAHAAGYCQRFENGSIFVSARMRRPDPSAGETVRSRHSCQ